MADKKNNKKEDNSFTPMVEQYLQLKRQYGDIILFFRLGDFYEMFLDDAELCSKELQLYLTSKACGNGKRIPMCGIPHRSYLTYAQKLIDRGYKVAICEQMEDPKLTKKLVKRDVVQIITPGANLETETSDNNFIAALMIYGSIAVIVYADLTTGEIKSVNLEADREKVLEKLLSIDVKELVVPTSIDASLIMHIKSNSQICISYHNDNSYSIESNALFVNLKDERQIDCATRLYNYLRDIEKRDLTYLKPVENLMSLKTMKIDYSAQSNMELVKSLDGKSFGTLYWLLNKTKTPMGARYLKAQILSPSADESEINRRQSMTQCFVENYLVREELRKDLENIFDMERLIARMGYESANGRDMLQLLRSLEEIPIIREHLSSIDDPNITSLIADLGDYDDLIDLLRRAIDENCPVTITEGGIFKRGYDERLDELIDLTDDAKTWITNLEISEKERTGIKNLKVGYNTVFGYYIEVSSGQLSLVKPEYGYIRKQTLKTGERFITAELKEKEDKILRAKDERMSLEYSLFRELRKMVASYTSKIQSTSQALSELDYFLSLAYVASENNYMRPSFNNRHQIDVKDARHPIIEKASPDVLFVENDYQMDEDTDVLMITGPNMGGKSTYMKEFGLIVIMAQIGSFVPASYCDMPIFSSLYTRIGASDNLIKGRSTFMTEMSEVAEALNSADSSSLFLFDEIGRGTATFDGMAIAQAIIEYIVKNIHAKTFFSTHYHEITELSEKITAIRNIHCDVKEEDGQITFLYKMRPGSMDKSYGINVAKLAGLPEEVTERGQQLLDSLEKREVVQKESIREIRPEKRPEDDIIAELKKLDPLTLSPMDALNYLIALKKRIKS